MELVEGVRGVHLGDGEGWVDDELVGAGRVGDHFLGGWGGGLRRLDLSLLLRLGGVGFGEVRRGKIAWGDFDFFLLVSWVDL